MQPKVDIDGPVAPITLAEGKRRNPLSRATMVALTEELNALGANTDVHVVILDADGPAFSAGHDLKEMEGEELAFYEDVLGVCTEMMQTLHAIPQPVIAKVDGIATAAGLQLVASCDMVIATDRSTFATPGVHIGLFCSTPMVAVSRSIGQKRCMQMLLTGEPIDAETAADWGLVNQVTTPDEIDDVLAALVARIARFSRHTIGVGKRAFYDQLGRHETDAYDLTRVVMADNAAHPVGQEGMSAFLEKRDADWPA